MHGLRDALADMRRNFVNDDFDDDESDEDWSEQRAHVDTTVVTLRIQDRTCVYVHMIHEHTMLYICFTA